MVGLLLLDHMGRGVCVCASWCEGGPFSPELFLVPCHESSRNGTFSLILMYFTEE